MNRSVSQLFFLILGICLICKCKSYSLLSKSKIFSKVKTRGAMNDFAGTGGSIVENKLVFKIIKLFEN